MNISPKQNSRTLWLLLSLHIHWSSARVEIPPRRIIWNLVFL